MRWPSQIGRYEVKAELGSGSTADVLLGEHVREDGSRGEVALKCVLREHTADEPSRMVLREEARILAALDHPNIVAFVELLEEPFLTLVLERMRGRTLKELDDRLLGSLALVLELGSQVADALAAVHTATDGAPLAIVHRDVSPDNLFVTTDGLVKLFDFNVAHSRANGDAPAPGALQGRVAYMAPEQARSEAVDGRADVFSLAVVLWELICSRRLFWRGTTLATLRALCDETAPRAATIRSDLPAALDELLAVALSPSRDARPHAAGFAAQLRAIAATLPGSASARPDLARLAALD